MELTVQNKAAHSIQPQEKAWHALRPEDVLWNLEAHEHGLTARQAAGRLAQLFSLIVLSL